jgi:hypothetical protein
MLIVLPFCFAVGFCIGYFWQDYRPRLRLQFRTIQETIRAIRVERFGVPLLAIALIAALFLSEEVVRVFLVRRVLEIAAVVVGAAAGAWFRSETRTRDQLAFIAGAGALLFLASLEYDNKLFRGLSKIGGGEFSVEFASPGAPGRPNREAPNQAFAAANENYLNAVFPGASKLRYAAGSLVALPKYMLDDERYANLFAGPQTGLSPDQLASPDLINQMPEATKLLLRYVCGRIVPFSALLEKLQEFHNSETSVLSVNPRLVAAIRREYLSARGWSTLDHSLADIQISEKESDGARSVVLVDDSKDLSELFINNGGAIRDELLALGVSQQEITSTGPQNNNCKDINSMSYPYYGYPFPNFSTNDKDSQGFFTYYALLVSLSELGVGSRESPIHLLEREINYQRANLPKGISESPTQAKLERVRRLVLLLRLENVQTRIMDSIQNSVLDLAEIRRYTQMVDDFNESLVFFDPKQDYRSSLLRRSLDDHFRADCAPELRKLGESASALFGRFTFAEIVVKNNALDAVGKNPSIVSAHPELIDTLDGYADEVSRFDVECPGLLGAQVTDDLNILKASFLDSASSYWEAKGENFRTSKNDETRLREIEINSQETIKALCDAKRAYARGKRMAENRTPSKAKEPKIYDQLNDEIEGDGAAVLPSAMQSGWDRAEAALSAYPAKEVEDACK